MSRKGLLWVLVLCLVCALAMPGLPEEVQEPEQEQPSGLEVGEGVPACQITNVVTQETFCHT